MYSHFKGDPKTLKKLRACGYPLWAHLQPPCSPLSLGEEAESTGVADPFGDRNPGTWILSSVTIYMTDPTS